MPVRLQPKAPIAAEAILVGDPGRSLLLAQELLEQPRMSNHARGLWGYSGRTAAGEELTIQATGIGGPSAAAVLADLAELGLRRAVRVGTCAALDADLRPGQLLLVGEAVSGGGSAAAFGVEPGAAVPPDAELLSALRQALGESAAPARIASLDAMPPLGAAPAGAVAADMQTAALLARGRQLGIAAAALLIVDRGEDGAPLEAAKLEEAAKAAGEVALSALSNPQVEG